MQQSLVVTITNLMLAQTNVIISSEFSVKKVTHHVIPPLTFIFHFAKMNEQGDLT